MFISSIGNSCTVKHVILQGLKQNVYLSSIGNSCTVKHVILQGLKQNVSFLYRQFLHCETCYFARIIGNSRC